MKANPLTLQQRQAAADRLRSVWLAKHKELGLTQERAAQMMRWRHQSAVANYLSGRSPMNLEALVKFSSLLRIDPAEISPELAALIPDGSPGGRAPEIDGYERAIRVGGAIAAPPSAGQAAIWQNETLDTGLAFSRNWLEHNGLDIQNCRLLEVFGEAMSDLLHDGDTVLFDAADLGIKSTNVYVLGIHGEHRIRRLTRLIDGSLRIICDNSNKQLYPDEVVPSDHVHSVQIIGRVRARFGPL